MKNNRLDSTRNDPRRLPSTFPDLHGTRLEPELTGRFPVAFSQRISSSARASHSSRPIGVIVNLAFGFEAVAVKQWTTGTPFAF